MDLNYITELTDSEFVELINFCIQSQNKRYEEARLEKEISPIKQVAICRELDRKDLEGNRYFWVCTADGPRVLSTYRIKDFDMKSEDGQEVDYTSDMRVFMTKRFGTEYIKALYQHQIALAEQEMIRLSGYVGKRI